MKSQELGLLPIFAGAGPRQLERLAKLFTAVTFAPGCAIFTAGDRATRLYVVRSGEVVIRFLPNDGGSLDLTTVRAGEAIGWSAALRRSYYTSSAICLTDVVALSIQAHDLHAIMAGDPQLARALLERAAPPARSQMDSLGQQVIRLLKPQSR